MLHVLAVPLLLGCECTPAPGIMLSLSASTSAKWSNRPSGHIQVVQSGIPMCLGFDGYGSVVALACVPADAGQQWGYSPFSDAHLLNRATKDCLT
eukprot:gene31261-25603_t